MSNSIPLYGTLESGLKTAYGDTLLDGYVNFMKWNIVGYGLDCVIDGIYSHTSN